jgi:NitT/TauT family transport system ATP-binding protein
VLGRSRDRKAPEFVGLVEHIYPLDDRASGAAIDRGCAADAGVGSPAARKRGRVVGPGRDHGPPRLSVAELADELYLEVDDLLPLIDALELLELAQVEAGQMELTPRGADLRRCRHPGVQGDVRRRGAGAGAARAGAV